MKMFWVQSHETWKDTRKPEASAYTLGCGPKGQGPGVGSASEPRIQKRRTRLPGRDGGGIWKKTGVGKIRRRKGPEPRASGRMGRGAERQPGFGRGNRGQAPGALGIPLRRGWGSAIKGSCSAPTHIKETRNRCQLCPLLVKPTAQKESAELSTGGSSEGAFAQLRQRDHRDLPGRTHGMRT